MNSYKLKISFFHPKYWFAWLGILALFSISLLPYSTILWLGKLIGTISSVLNKPRGKIVHHNIQLCFPELSEAEAKQKVRVNFENTGIALLERGMAWFWPSWRVNGLVKVTGLEHLEQAKQDGQDIIFLGAHFLTLEMGARALGLVHPSAAIYPKNAHSVLDFWFYWTKIREHNAMLDDSYFKSMLRTLKKGEALWYAQDHDNSLHTSGVLTPFFAVENPHGVAGESNIERTKNNCVIPMFLKRLPEEVGYELTFLPKLDDFPSKDSELDSQRTSQQIEKMIAECEDQYMWTHSRLKHASEDEPSLS